MAWSITTLPCTSQSHSPKSNNEVLVLLFLFLFFFLAFQTKLHPLNTMNWRHKNSANNWGMFTCHIKQSELQPLPDDRVSWNWRFTQPYFNFTHGALGCSLWTGPFCLSRFIKRALHCLHCHLTSTAWGLYMPRAFYRNIPRHWPRI